MWKCQTVIYADCVWHCCERLSACSSDPCVFLFSFLFFFLGAAGGGAEDADKVDAGLKVGFLFPHSQLPVRNAPCRLHLSVVDSTVATDWFDAFAAVPYYKQGWSS